MYELQRRRHGWRHLVKSATCSMDVSGNKATYVRASATDDIAKVQPNSTLYSLPLPRHSPRRVHAPAAHANLLPHHTPPPPPRVRRAWSRAT